MIIDRINRLSYQLSLLFLLLAFPEARALEYLDHDSLGKALQELARDHREWIHLDTLTRSSGGQEIWQIEVGTGSDKDRSSRPALLIVAGVDGDDLMGPVCVLHWLNQLMKEQGTNTNIQLTNTTLYVIPSLNPDSASAFFAKPKRASETNLEPVDDDHDGLKDEDPTEDLNGDGLITSMRIQDPAGQYILDPEDNRLLLKADPLRGEHGSWNVLSEGIDNDKDEEWNEDGPGGINLNRNFAYNFSFFASDSGRHPMSQPETRALAEFVISHPNIAIAFTFGSADNLVSPPKSESPKRPPVTIHPDDLPYYRELGKDWRNQLELKKELSGASFPGTFSDWVYYHQGRLSLAARPWFPALQLQRPAPKNASQPTAEGTEAKSEQKEEAKAQEEKPKADKPKEEKKSDDKRNEEERKFLHWLDERAPQSFVPWQTFNHPDFPGKKVEIGGYAPFAQTLPPAALLEELADKESAFLSSLLSRLPRLHLRETQVKALGQDVYDITLTIENVGFLPTSLTQGEVTNEVHPTRVVFALPRPAFLSGSPRVLLPPLAGSGGSREVRVVVYVPDQRSIDVEVISMLAGSIRFSVQLAQP